jgi:hypothetical protein
MNIKKECYELAKEHNLEIRVEMRNWYYEVNLPEGYQISEDDDRTGLCMSLHFFSKPENVYYSLRQDIEEIVSYKPWHKIN